MKKPEILAPAGDLAMLNAAIDAGVDAVYFGTKILNMRTKAKNFELSQLKKIVDLCHSHNVKAYLTVNTIIYESELNILDKLLKTAREAGIDAVIAWDLAVIKKAVELGMEIHLSTQASVSNSEALKEYEQLGIKRVVLARECNLRQIKEIKNKTNLEIECFVHGAMCISISGRCFMSQFLYNCSANRGECLQPCRREYKIKDVEDDKELIVGSNYVISPKDICTIEILDKLIGVVDVFKIEGRSKTPEYVKTVVKCYREAVDLYFKGKFTLEEKARLIKELETVYNRGFSTGFYMGVPVKEWAETENSKATKIKKYAGKITKLYKKISVAELKVESGELRLGDNILILGNKTGAYEQKVKSMEIERGKPIFLAKKGEKIGILIDNINKISPKDKLFLYQNKH